MIGTMVAVCVLDAFLRFLGLRNACVRGNGVCFVPTYGLPGCCLWRLHAQTNRTDFDAVWWNNGGCASRPLHVS